MKKHFIAAFVFTIGLFLSSSASAIALHVGSGANFNWCTTNSGTIAVSYSECIGLAWLYQETNGDSWGQHDNWFQDTTFGGWDGWNGNDHLGWQVFGGGIANLAGGHIHEIYLMNNNLSGSIMTGLLYLPYLQVLGLGGNSISSANISQLSGVEVINLGGNRISSVSVSSANHPSLVSLDVSYNRLSSIDVSQTTGLTALYANDNTGLTSIVVNTYTTYPTGLVGNAHFDNIGYTPTDSNTLSFLRTYDPNWGYRGIGGGTARVIPKDNCPDGDLSDTPYDGLCAGKSALNGTLATTGGANNTGSVSVAIGTAASTGNILVAGTTVFMTGTLSTGVVVVLEQTPLKDDAPCNDAETESAYMFARAHGITTMETCAKARMSDQLTRAEAAKMISNYAMDVLGKKPNKSLGCFFSDIVGITNELAGYVTTSCQLGVMFSYGFVATSHQICVCRKIIHFIFHYQMIKNKTSAVFCYSRGATVYAFHILYNK